MEFSLESLTGEWFPCYACQMSSLLPVNLSFVVCSTLNTSLLGLNKKNIINITTSQVSNPINPSLLDYPFDLLHISPNLLFLVTFLS